MAMVADRFIAAGEELSFVYVSAPDAVLLVQYAMAPEVLGNLHNMAGARPWGHLEYVSTCFRIPVGWWLVGDYELHIGDY